MSSADNEKITCETLAQLDVSLAAVAVKEIESLKQTIHEKETHIMAMEQVCLSESERQAELEDSIIAWQDKYDRLYESHKRVQKVNQGLEDKLLKLVDRNTGERAQLTSDVATLSVRLAQANFNISKLQRDIERYKTDINLAIQLLQCKPDSFVPQKISSLPIDIQSKVSSYMRLDTNSHSDSEGSITGVAVSSSSTTAAYKVLPASDSPPRDQCPFPPTAMVYSMRGLDEKLKSESSMNLANNNNSNNSNNNNSTNSDALNNNTNNNNNNNSSSSNSSNSINNLTNNNHLDNFTPSTVNPLKNSTASLNTNTSAYAGNDNTMISPIVMAKFLEDELKAGEIKHCGTCHCSKDLTVLADVSRSYSVATQTPFQLNAINYNNNNSNSSGCNDINNTPQLCLRCYSNLNSPSRTNSPFNRNLLRSSDSVISETKSSVSDLNDMDKLFTPAKKDDLMVNPILGHHRMSERSFAQKCVGLTSSAAHKLSYNALLDNVKTANRYQRRFIDGGGTALDLLEEKTKTQKSKKHLEDINGNEDLEDEEKPLLGPNLHQIQANNEQNMKAKSTTTTTTKAESSCELGVGTALGVVNSEQLKSPSASTKSAVETLKSTGIVTGSLTKTNMTGSVNSVWSKSSSYEGAKMFENFNRNLIKTIKAENPKHRGPRLCSMRIQQNGQSNILLDNIESIETMTPVIYRRRERLLDEELDDGKEVITSKTTQPAPELQQQQPAIETAKEAMECEDSHSLTALPQPDVVVTATTLIEQVEMSNDEQELAALVANNEKTDSLLIDDCNVETNANENATAVLQLQSAVTCDNSCKNSAGTQSSSISDNIDFQETVILRRQQLSRVAEWVQNNTQQMERDQQQKHISMLNHCDANTVVTDHHQTSFAALDQLDSVSVEKLSMDSGYKTTPQFQQIANSSQEETIKTSDDSLSPKSEPNANCPPNFTPASANNILDEVVKLNETQVQNIDSADMISHVYSTPQTYYRRTSRSGLPVAYTSADPQDTSSVCSQITTEQPICDIVNYKYYPSDSEKTRAQQVAELHPLKTQQVDIAQMEYNVKQFLLKQNEWSMRSSSATTSANMPINRHASIRPHKLFTSMTASGFGPGKGERVVNVMSVSNDKAKSLNATTTTATTAGTTTATTTTSNNYAASHMNGTIPQRTETNL